MLSDWSACEFRGNSRVAKANRKLAQFAERQPKTLGSTSVTIGSKERGSESIWLFTRNCYCSQLVFALFFYGFCCFLPAFCSWIFVFAAKFKFKFRDGGNVVIVTQFWRAFAPKCVCKRIYVSGIWVWAVVLLTQLVAFTSGVKYLKGFEFGLLFSTI